jgi:hypothetical protein
MKRTNRAAGFAAAVLVAAALHASAGAGTLAPEMLDPGDPSWEDFWRLELSGALPAGSTNLRPIPRGEAAAWIAGASENPLVGSEFARLRRSFAREIRRSGAPVSERETPATIRLAGEAAPDDPALDGARSELRIGPTLSFQTRGGDGRTVLGDSTRAGLYGVLLYGTGTAIQGELFIGEIRNGRSIGDPLIAHTDILYFSENVGVAFAARDLRVRLARARHRWGPAPGSSLLLDGAAPPVNFLEWNLSLPARIRFSSWTGSLNVSEKRGIAAHRIDIPISRDLAIGLSEGVRYAGGPEHPLYLLGLLPYTLVQRLDEQDTADPATREAQRNNVLAAIDAVWRPRGGWLTYVEALVDDLPAATNDTPPRVGGRIGVATLARIAGVPVEIGVEGTKVGRYVYSVDYGNGCECGWGHQGFPLGEPNGPDREAVQVWAKRSVSRDHRLEARAIVANKGAGRFGEAWTPGVDGSDHPTRDALRLTPPVERRRSLAVGWRWDPRDNFFVDVRATAARIRNAGNRSAAGADDRFEVVLLAGWRR